MSYDLSGHELQVENGFVPRPEEDRITQAEKNERINAQLKVKTKLNWPKQSVLNQVAWYKPMCSLERISLLFSLFIGLLASWCSTPSLHFMMALFSRICSFFPVTEHLLLFVPFNSVAECRSGRNKDGDKPYKERHSAPTERQRRSRQIQDPEADKTGQHQAAGWHVRGNVRISACLRHANALGTCSDRCCRLCCVDLSVSIENMVKSFKFLVYLDMLSSVF